MADEHRNNVIHFTLLAGPQIDLQPFSPEGDLRIGRSEGCDLTLPDPTVSRLHAVVRRRQDRWFITDRGARHGTYLNDVRLEVSEPTLLASGDHLRIGPFLLRVRIAPDDQVHPAADAEPELAMLDDLPEEASASHVEEIRGSARVAAHQLRLILDSAASITGQLDEETIAAHIVRAACEGTGFRRAVLLRAGSTDQAEVIASFPNDAGTRALRFSRSLVMTASQGRTVQLARKSDAVDFGQSIADLGIATALCIPVRVANAISTLLYLDDAGGRDRDAQPPESVAVSAQFCEALARLCGLGLANVRRHDLETRSIRIESELAAARGTQQLLMPNPALQDDAPVRWALRSHPGRFVAGDLFDVINLDRDRMAVVIGDVTGEGVEAGVLMAAAQSYLHALLRGNNDLVESVAALNRYVCNRSSAQRFITLWVGIVEAGSPRIRSIDAGHGHWGIRRADGRLDRITHRGGIPIGIDPSFPYAEETFDLQSDERLILYTDGIIEQPGADGDAFGGRRLGETLAATRDAAEDADAVFAALHAFTGGRAWTDDATFASVAAS